MDEDGYQGHLLERVLRSIVIYRGLLPSYLYISGVKRMSKNPVRCGGFADVWLGEARGQRLALKVLRIIGDCELVSGNREVSVTDEFWFRR